MATGLHGNLTVEQQRMLFIPLPGEGGMGQGLSIPPEDWQLRAALEPTQSHSAGSLQMLQKGCMAAGKAGGGGRTAWALREASTCRMSPISPSALPFQC